MESAGKKNDHLMLILMMMMMIVYSEVASFIEVGACVGVFMGAVPSSMHWLQVVKM